GASDRTELSNGFCQFRRGRRIVQLQYSTADERSSAVFVLPWCSGRLPDDGAIQWGLAESSVPGPHSSIRCPDRYGWKCHGQRNHRPHIKANQRRAHYPVAKLRMTHRRMVARRGILRNHRRNNNSPATRQETEVDAAGKPSVASSGPPRGAEASLQVGGHSIAPVVGQVLRCALTASPFGLRRAALRTRPTKPGMP